MCQSGCFSSGSILFPICLFAHRLLFGSSLQSESGQSMVGILYQITCFFLGKHPFSYWIFGPPSVVRIVSSKRIRTINGGLVVSTGLLVLKEHPFSNRVFRLPIVVWIVSSKRIRAITGGLIVSNRLLLPRGASFFPSAFSPTHCRLDRLFKTSLNNP